MIGGLLFFLGVGLAVPLGLVPLLGGLSPSPATLAPGEYLNTTVILERGGVLTYFVAVQDYSQGDELTVFLQLPAGDPNNLTMVSSGDPYVATYEAEAGGPHAVVIQNTGTQEVTVLHAAAEVDLAAGLWLALGGLLAIVGIVVAVVGLILWIVDRGRRRRAPPISP